MKAIETIHGWVSARAVRRSLFLAVLASLAVGCQLFGGVQVESIAQTTNKPGQVAVYLSVRDGEQPLTRLQPNHFRLYENETQLDPTQVQLQLLPRDSVAAQQVLVLVDLSGDIDQPGRRALLAKQLASFVDRLRAQQGVSVYGFDGGEKLHALGKFPKQEPKPGSKAPEFPGLMTHRQADSSSNLHGAILTALSQLDFELNATGQPIKLGRLVILARGPDLAGRTIEERVTERLDQVSHHVFMLGVEKEPNTGFTERIGRHGHLLASNFDNMESQLGELAGLVERDLGQYYLLSYCSPARSGQRVLLIEVGSPTAEGDEKTGKVEVQFSADGFGSACDASRIPRFAGGSTPSKSPPPGGASPAETPGADAAAAEAGGNDEAVPPPTSPTYAE